VSDADAFLKVDKLTSGYGRSRVLFDLSLTAGRRGAVAILGRKGDSKADVKRLAAWTTVARVLLNLDETITRE